MRFNLLLALIASTLFWSVSCNYSTRKYTEQEIATSWAEMTLYITQFTPQNSPTYASRCIGYIGLTMYESIVHGFPEHNSMAGKLNKLDALPLPDTSLSYDWLVSLNAAQASILDSIYNQTSDENKVKIDSLEQALHNYLSKKAGNRDVIERSVAYGQSVAKAIFKWAKTDGGHRAYLRNFDKSFTYKEYPGSWRPPLFAQAISHNPLHPYWGQNRTFLQVNREIPTPYMIPYDTAKSSPYFEQFKAVYEKEQILTEEEKQVAIWWSDDPDVTFTPPGHSYYLATTAIKVDQPPLIKCAETYARVGMAVADAFIKCWEWKYHFFSERPNTYVPKEMDPMWESFWPDPPFPSFPSGHAIQAAAMAVVLTDLYGEAFAFADSAHYGRERDELRDTDFVVQEFESFWQVATETAASRFYGGIHTHQDNNVGLEEGSKIARNVNQLPWRKEKEDHVSQDTTQTAAIH